MRYYTSMRQGKLYRFKLLGYDAIILDGRFEVSVPDEYVGSKIVMRISSSLMNGKLKSLRINMPNKIIFASAKDKEHIVFRAEEHNNKKIMN